MESDSDRILFDAIRDKIRKDISLMMSQSRQGAFAESFNTVTAAHGPVMQSLIFKAIAACLDNEELFATITKHVRHLVVTQLHQKFESELEKQVNQFKIDLARRVVDQ